MSLKSKSILSLMAVIAVAVMIFLFSAQDGDDSSNLSGIVSEWVLTLLVPGYSDMSRAEKLPYLAQWGFWVRKAAHFTEYALLAATLVVFLHYVMRRGMLSVFALAWVMATLYAGTDELHQMFVDGRGPALMDVCIDSAGALTGCAAMSAILMLRGRLRRGQTTGLLR